MPSPFPGMNPYLENEYVFHDFHERLLPSFSDLLVPQVRPDYIVKLDQDVYLTEPSGEERRLLGRPDVHLAGSGKAGNGPHGGAVALEAPAWARWAAAIDEEKHAFLEIRDREDRALVTVIEVLSPTNKLRHRDAFLAKRNRYQESSVHYVEIDLLRDFGPRLPLSGLPECEYYALVSRLEDRPAVAVWPIRLRDALPVIPIPLKPEHAPARLDLKAALDRVYDAAAYEDYVYSGRPEPALSAADETWARSLLPE